MLVQNSGTKIQIIHFNSVFLNRITFKHTLHTSHSNNIEEVLTALADINFGGIKDRFGGPLLKKKCFEAGPDLLSSFE